MRLPLRRYQIRVLEDLGRYLDLARTTGAKRAFIELAERSYRTVPQLDEVPYICLRVPTGGGKTILAAHAVGLLAERYLQREAATVLWLVPSNAIRDQTLDRLRAHGDPYREALSTPFSGRVTVLNLEEALGVQRSTLDGETTVIVATVQAFRVEDGTGRKVYEQNGALQHHFSGLAPVLLNGLEHREDGTPVESLANVLRLRHPFVVMDEAHNARTHLSFETLARFAPAGILELTATPETTHKPESGRFASNVLAHVSAAELKAEEMIKLPVKLWTKPLWQEAVGDAVARQRDLEKAAAEEQRLTGEYIRPIILFQAQSQRGEAPIGPEELKQALVENHRVAVEQIAIATGGTRELDGVDLTDAACPVRFIITVQALREGWDCPWAYVLCSIAEQSGARAVEQILGRVLRLPEAARKRIDVLNASYAYVVSTNFAEAAAGLRDALVENGFEKFEAGQVIEEEASQPSVFFASAANPAKVEVEETPQAAVLAAPGLSAVSWDERTRTLAVTAPMSREIEEVLLGAFETTEGKAKALELARASRGEPAPAPMVGAREPFFLPQFAVRRNGELTLFDQSEVSEVEWRVGDKDVRLSEEEYARARLIGQAGELDVSVQGRLQMSFEEQVAQQLSLLQGEIGWTVSALTVWLDRHIAHPDLVQGDVMFFIRSAVEALLGNSGLTVEQLARDKYRLRDALEAKIDGYRAAQHGRVFQGLLFARPPKAEVTARIGCLFDPTATYGANWHYEGGYQFKKHLFPVIGELKAEGEEMACAVRLDEHPKVKVWSRNLERRDTAFWLPTPTDKFYPDFVGKLVDGRVFAVEYKGQHLWSNEDSVEKRKVGELWAEASSGKCVFVMPNGADWAALARALE